MAARTQTLLFTDIVGSTELLTRCDGPAADRLRAAHFASLREQIARHGGREIKNLGDGLMVAFHAAGDATQCAVGMQQASVRRHGSGQREAMPIRVGVSSGDVSIEDGDCFGTAVVEASRLCARAAASQILLAESTRLLASDRPMVREIGTIPLEGLPEPTRVWEAEWTPETPTRVRAVIADDAVLMREGIAYVLEASGVEVVGQAANVDELLQLTAELHPDLAIVDVRMPPTHTSEGLHAALRIRAEHPTTGVLLLTMDVEPRYASRLLEASRAGVGYLLKERVSDTREFAAAARRVANGGTAFEPVLLTRLGHADGADPTIEAKIP